MEIVSYHHLPAGQTPSPMRGSQPFKAVVVIEQDVTPDWQARVSEWLVRSGCRYMMAWGRACSSWDDSVDEANLAAFDFGDIPDESFVMTTWHEGEPLEEVFWFAEHAAIHPMMELTRTIIVHITANAREVELLGAFQRAQRGG